jgi:hypothetical protein
METVDDYKTLNTAYKGDDLFKTKKEEEIEARVTKELEKKYKNELEEKLIKLENEVTNKENKNTEYKLDSVVTSVINKFMERSKIGKEKYGTDLDRNDLSLYEWILHAQEEHMDAILYLEKIKKVIVKS